MKLPLATDKKLVLFDGVCNLCNSSVTFIIKKDGEDVFRYASLQSPLGQQLLQEFGFSPNELKSIMLVDAQGNYWVKSSAILKIAEQLKGYSWLKVFLYVPKFIRDGIYGLIARYRYRWFGKKQECMIPTPELKSKFLDE